jgi:hypothetical protein
VNTLATALYLVVGLVNLLPVSGVLSTGRLEALYGVSVADPNLIVLMRHRAVLFGIVGALLIAAAFHPPLRVVAFVAGLVSMLSFVAIAYGASELNAELRRVVAVDLVASLLLVGAGVITIWGARTAAG